MFITFFQFSTFIKTIFTTFFQFSTFTKKMFITFFQFSTFTKKIFTTFFQFSTFSKKMFTIKRNQNKTLITTFQLLHFSFQTFVLFNENRKIMRPCESKVKFVLKETTLYHAMNWWREQKILFTLIVDTVAINISFLKYTMCNK